MANEISNGKYYFDSGNYAAAKGCFQRAKDTVSDEGVSLQLDTDIISCTLREALKKGDKFLKAVPLHELDGKCRQIALNIDKLKQSGAKVSELRKQNRGNTEAIQNAICSNTYNDALEIYESFTWDTVEECQTGCLRMIELFKTAESLYRSNLKVQDAVTTQGWIAKIQEERGDASMDHDEFHLAFDSYLEALNIALHIKPAKKQRKLFLSLFNAYEQCAGKQQAICDIYRRLPLEALFKDATPEEQIELAYAAYQLNDDLSWAQKVVDVAAKATDAHLYKKEISECRHALLRRGFEKGCNDFAASTRFDRFSALVVIKILSTTFTELIQREKSSIVMLRKAENFNQAIEALDLFGDDEIPTNRYTKYSPKKVYNELTRDYVDVLDKLFPNNKEKVHKTLEELSLEIGNAFLAANTVDKDPESAACFLAAAAPINRRASQLLQAINSQEYLQANLLTCANSPCFTPEKAQFVLRNIGLMHKSHNQANQANFAFAISTLLGDEESRNEMTQDYNKPDFEWQDHRSLFKAFLIEYLKEPDHLKLYSHLIDFIKIEYTPRVGKRIKLAQ